MDICQGCHTHTDDNSSIHQIISLLLSPKSGCFERLTSPTCPVIKGLPYLLTLINTFIGWMYSQLQGTADTMAPVLLEHIIPRFGMPFPPSSWDINAGITSPGSRAYLLFHLADSSMPLLYNQGTSLFHSFSDG